MVAIATTGNAIVETRLSGGFISELRSYGSRRSRFSSVLHGNYATQDHSVSLVKAPFVTYLKPQTGGERILGFSC